MRELKIRSKNERLRFEYCEPVIRKLAIVTIILATVVVSLIALLSGSWVHALKTIAATAAGVGLSLIALYRTEITRMVDVQICSANTEGRLLDMPAIVDDLYSDRERELTFRRASQWLFVSGAIATLSIAEPRFAASAFVAGFIFLLLVSGELAANLVITPVLVVLIVIAANPRFDLGGGWWLLGAMPFVFACLYGSKTCLGRSGFLFGTLLRRAVIRASEDVEDIREVYGSGLVSNDEDEANRATGSVERGQSADSDKAADALAAQTKRYQEN